MSAEEAVRNYLQYLDDPDSLRDDAKIAELEAAAASAGDAIERLRALDALAKANVVDGSQVRMAFVAHAKAWADGEGIDVAAFRAMGVPADVLRDAGFGGPAPRRSRPSSDGGTRSRVTQAEIRAAVPSAPFTKKDLVATSGASIGSVTKVIDEMIASGELENRGQDPDWAGRGRVPTLYARA